MLSRLKYSLLSLSRQKKIAFALASDVLVCIASCWLAIALRVGDISPTIGLVIRFAWYPVVIMIVVFSLTGVYRSVFRFSSRGSANQFIRPIAWFGFLVILSNIVIGDQEVPRTAAFIQVMLFGLGFSFSRVGAGRFLREVATPPQIARNKSRVLIYGAGEAGLLMSSSLMPSGNHDVIGFVDDDVSIQGRMLLGYSVWSFDDLDSLVERFSVDLIILAMPGLSREDRNRVIRKVEGCRVAVKSVPPLEDILQENGNYTSYIDLDVDDLLCRDEVNLDHKLLYSQIADRTVLVTGAGGSIGSEICYQLLLLKPRKIILFDISEFNLYQLQERLTRVASQWSFASEVELVFLLGSVQDRNFVDDIVKSSSPDVIFHVAAYKHVPLVEKNLLEALKNNTFGTLNIATAAISHSVKKCILVSTDKAVNPLSMMGASKRLAEMIFQAQQSLAFDATELSIVRFGNVLNSSGSVIPKFRSQIEAGGPLTITHRDVTRFFMTISEAAQLVIQATALGVGGDVFILEMGSPVRIEDLAKKMICMAGKTVRDRANPSGDLSIEVIGLREGEKLHEELVVGGDLEATRHPAILKAKEMWMPWDQLQEKLEKLSCLIESRDVEACRKFLQVIVK